VKVLGIFILMNNIFIGTKVLGTFTPEERKFQGANVPRNESSTGAKVRSVDFSLQGMKVQRNDVMYNVAVVSLRVVTWVWRRVPAVFCL